MNAFPSGMVMESLVPGCAEVHRLIGLDLDWFLRGEASQHELAACYVFVVWRQFEADARHEVAVPV